MLRGHRARIFLTYTFHDDYDSIGFDNAMAGYLAARHLIELGHRSIGFISGPRRCNDRMALRLKGAVDAMAEAGLELPPELVTEQEFSLSGGKLGAIQLMGLARPPTAILASNDLLAAGALHELSERGIDVPGNISVIGMENLDITGFTRPKLTSIHLPTEEIGTATAHHILARLRGEDVPRRVEFQVALVIRHSTGPTPRAV